MLYEGQLIGKYVSLRPVTIEDASFIIKIRNDETKNSYIHKTSTNLKNQIEWIQSQIIRFGDYYFIINNKINNPIGLASVYNMCEHSIEFGRWISWGNPYENLETVLLLFDFAFNSLFIDCVYTRTMIENRRVISFWKTFGAKIEGEIEEDNLLLEKSIVLKDDYFTKIRPRVLKILRF